MHRSNMRGIICAKTGLGKAHYIDSFAGMMSSLRKIAGKTNIPSSPTVKKSNPSFAFLLHLNIGDVALPPPCLNMYVRKQKSMDLIW